MTQGRIIWWRIALVVGIIIALVEACIKEGFRISGSSAAPKSRGS